VYELLIINIVIVVLAHVTENLVYHFLVVHLLLLLFLLTRDGFLTIYLIYKEISEFWA
jgi:hypothetical protein